MIPFDSRKPLDPSGIRLGTPALTTRGLKEADIKIIGETIVSVLTKKLTPEQAKAAVSEVIAKFPLYPDL